MSIVRVVARYPAHVTWRRLSVWLLLGIAGLATFIGSGRSVAQTTAQAIIQDASHWSDVFGEQRFYRIFLPRDYEVSTKRYPVVYFFHGWGERYNLTSAEIGNYDTGYNGDNISSYVGSHDVIVVKWDGFNPRFAGDAYQRPYNIGPVETYRQFPLYFPELVQYIDSHYRTIPDRAHRGISGVSMGGFMSYWVAGKFPHLVNSASSFMGSPEFFAGPLGFPTEYLHTPVYRNYEGVRTRLVTGTRDFIRWYHRRMNAVWLFTRPDHETQQFDSAHGTPGMGITLDFHVTGFGGPVTAPALWHHADIYPSFDVWGYSVSSNRTEPGFTVLDNVSPRGFRSSVRQWLPTGNLLPGVTLTITTDAMYVPGQTYSITDVNLDDGLATQAQQTADQSGKLRFVMNGQRHEIGISASAEPIVTIADWRLVSGPLPTNGRLVSLKLAFVNKGARDTTGIVAQAQSDSAVEIVSGDLTVDALAAGATAEATAPLQFIVHDASREVVALKIQVHVGGQTVVVPLEVPAFADVPGKGGLVVNDGAAVSMWQHAVSITTQAIGTGDRDAVIDPAETVPVLIFGGSAYRAGEMFTFDPCVDLGARLSDSWSTYDNVGASVKYSLPRISPTCPPGHQLTFFVRYQFPNKPEHILEEGIFTAIVGGPATSAPTVTTAPPTGIATTSARLNGTVNPGGQATTVYFQWGTSTSYGKTTAPQAIGGGTADVSVSATISGLRRDRVYHYRAVATNASGTRYGADTTFRTAKK